MIKILLIDGQQLTARGIKKILTDSAFELVTGQGKSYIQIDKLVKQHEPKVILADPISACNLKTADLMALKRSWQNIPIIALTNLNQRAEILNLLSAGISGHISKSASEAELLAGIDVILRGQSFFCRHTRSLLYDEEQAGGSSQPAFSPREKEIIQLI